MTLLPSIFLLLIPIWMFLTNDASSHQIPTSRIVSIIQLSHIQDYPSVNSHLYGYVLDPEYVEHIRFYYGGALSQIALALSFSKNVAAVTYWDNIFFALDKYIYSPSLLAHELVHTVQYKKPFLLYHALRYIYYWLFKGYYQVPYEIEAMEFQRV